MVAWSLAYIWPRCKTAYSAGPRCRARLIRLTSLPTRESESRHERRNRYAVTQYVEIFGTCSTWLLLRHKQASSSRHPIHSRLKLVFESLLQFYATPSLFPPTAPRSLQQFRMVWPRTVGSNGCAEEVPSPPGQGSNSTVERIAVSVCCCC